MLKKYALSPDIIAFSTQRAGGVSIGAYATFNATHYCGDDPQHVARNKQLLCEELGIPTSHLIVPHQVHDTRSLEINTTFLSSHLEKQAELLEGVDAVYTTEKGVCVCVSTADCIPVLLYHAEAGLVAAIHAGWRGTCARIVEKTLSELKNKFKILGEGFQAVIGPGISLESFEVGDEVYEAFRGEGFPMERIARRFPAAAGEKWHIDLWECNRQQLLSQGIPETQIQVAGVCTYKNPDQFFSARRLGIRSGRILSGIMQIP